MELHVVDPATAVRRFTLGGTTCVIGGPPSPAGAVCEDTTFARARVLNWTAGTVRFFTIQGPTAAYISPAGDLVALTPGPDTGFDGTSRSFIGLRACGWIDDTHVIAGGDAQQQPRIGNVTTGAVVPVAALGLCAGRLPGGL